jgi:hypothetical protein
MFLNADITDVIKNKRYCAGHAFPPADKMKPNVIKLIIGAPAYETGRVRFFNTAARRHRGIIILIF